MGRFRALFILGVKGFFSWKNIILLVVLAAVSMYGVHKGVLDIKKLNDERSKFQKNENFKFSILGSYNQYTTQGIAVFYLSPSSGLFYTNPESLDELYGTVNSIITLNIDSNCKNRQIFNNNGSFQFRFSAIVMVLMSLIMLFQGYEAFKNLEYLKVLAANWSPLKVFLTILFNRVLLNLLCFLLIIGCSLFLLRFESIDIHGSVINGLLVFLLIAALTLIFFLVLGFVLGNLRSRLNRAVILLTVWIGFVFIWPAVINSIIEVKAVVIPPAVIADNQKLKIVNDFEKWAIKYHGEAKKNTVEGSRKVLDEYLKMIFPNVEAEDIGQKEIIVEVIKKYRDVSVFVPTSFYTMTCQELSGRGYGSYLEMYDYLLDVRRRFVRFWIDRMLYNDPKVLVNFIKDDENVYRSRGLVPPNYWQGVGLTLIYIILLTLLSYLLFKRSLYYVNKKEIAKLGPLDVKADSGEFCVKLIKGNILNKALYPVLAGKARVPVKKGLKGSIIIVGKDLLLEKHRQDFVYICRPQDLPADLKVKHWLEFHCRWNRKSRAETRSILKNPAIKEILNKTIDRLEELEAFALSMKILEISIGTIYLLNDLTGDIVINDMVPFKDLVDRLNREGAAVIYLTRPQLVEMKLIADDKLFADGLNWRQMVSSAQAAVKFETKKSSTEAAGKIGS